MLMISEQVEQRAEEADRAEVSRLGHQHQQHHCQADGQPQLPGEHAEELADQLGRWRVSLHLRCHGSHRFDQVRVTEGSELYQIRPLT